MPPLVLPARRKKRLARKHAPGAAYKSAGNISQTAGSSSPNPATEAFELRSLTRFKRSRNVRSSCPPRRESMIAVDNRARIEDRGTSTSAEFWPWH